MNFAVFSVTAGVLVAFRLSAAAVKARERAMERAQLRARAVEHFYPISVKDDYYPGQSSHDRMREWGAAQKRSRELLFSHLDARQRDDYLRQGHFDVKGSDGGIYRIRSRGGIYSVIHDGRAWCTVVDRNVAGLVPTADQVLAQVLLIRTNARKFKRIAHSSGDSYWQDGLYWST